MLPKLCLPKIHNLNKWKKTTKVVLVGKSKKLSKLFNERVNKLFQNIIKRSECLEMLSLYFSKYPRKKMMSSPCLKILDIKSSDIQQNVSQLLVVQAIRSISALIAEENIFD